VTKPSYSLAFNKPDNILPLNCFLIHHFVEFSIIRGLHISVLKHGPPSRKNIKYQMSCFSVFKRFLRITKSEYSFELCSVILLGRTGLPLDGFS
jgi:hypothetical protein